MYIFKKLSVHIYYGDRMIPEGSFETDLLRQLYLKVEGLGDRLRLIKEQIDWEAFRPLIASLFYDNPITGGRPHTDEVLILRCFALQQLYSLSDEETEYMLNDRLSFRNFVGIGHVMPDFTTLWKIRERMREKKLDEQIWTEMQRQLNAKGFEIKKGVIQDATFTEADQGRKRKEIERKLEKIGKKPAYTPNQLAHMDTDGTYTVKQEQVHYGYKTHVKMDVDNQLIRSYEVSTASLHDSQINLVVAGDGIAYRDKGYAGTQLPDGVEDKTMRREYRNKKLAKEDEEYNNAISKIRCIGERPFAVMKKVFHGGHTFVKRIGRVRVKEMFSCFVFNLYQLVTIQRIALKRMLNLG